MSKLPYIPIYIGDWEQDTNTISLESEGALLKLTFKLWKSNEKGLLHISLQQLSFLLKKSEEISLKIAKELKENNVLNVEFLEQNLIKFESRRMIKEAHLSKVRSKSGSEGGKKNQSKNEAKLKQNPEYDIENEIDIILKNKSVEFQKVWAEWLDYRIEIKKPYKSLKSVFNQLKILNQVSDQTASGMIRQSITNSWQGIFDLKNNGYATTKNNTNNEFKPGGPGKL